MNRSTSMTVAATLVFARVLRKIVRDRRRGDEFLCSHSLGRHRGHAARTRAGDLCLWGTDADFIERNIAGVS